jgi:hypothetical protein
MASIEEIREGLIECVDKANEIASRARLNLMMSHELNAALSGLWGQGIPLSTDFADMQHLAIEAAEANKSIQEMMEDFVGKAPDYSSRL